MVEWFGEPSLGRWDVSGVTCLLSRLRLCRSRQRVGELCATEGPFPGPQPQRTGGERNPSCLVGRLSRKVSADAVVIRYNPVLCASDPQFTDHQTGLECGDLTYLRTCRRRRQIQALTGRPPSPAYFALFQRSRLLFKIPPNFSILVSLTL